MRSSEYPYMLPDERPFAAAPALGVVLAGGASRRFGTEKAWAPVAGRSLLDRVVHALTDATGEPVVISADPRPFEARGLRCRPDLRAGAGPLAGLETALAWALELERGGALVLACDMPFVPSSLLTRLVSRAAGGDPLVVVPEGGSRRGIEPLCAWYSVELLPRVRKRLEAGERALHPLAASGDGVIRLPRSEVETHGDLSRIFLNVNTPADHLRAERLAGEAP